MSIIIEDMTMPECCMKCPMSEGYGCGYMGVAMATKDMKSGRHENCPLEEADDGWIPCSERLPEDEYVLISKKPTKISGSKWSVAIAIRTADPRSRKIQWRDIGFGVIQDDKVLAWMPLPEPYKEDDHDE